MVGRGRGLEREGAPPFEKRAPPSRGPLGYPNLKGEGGVGRMSDVAVVHDYGGWMGDMSKERLLQICGACV